MGEDMTYAAEPTRAQLAARVQELEAWRDACPYSVEKLRINQTYKHPIYPDNYRAVFGAMADWLEKYPQTAQAADDTPDAPLTLAAIDDEDGDL